MASLDLLISRAKGKKTKVVRLHGGDKGGDELHAFGYGSCNYRRGN